MSCIYTKSHNFLWISLIFPFLVACSSSKKTTVTPGAKTLPTLPYSEVNIPVKIYLKPLLARMDSITAREFTSEKWPGYFPASCDFRYRYRFIRSPFAFSCVDNKVTIAFRGYYQISGSRSACAFGKQVSPWVSGSCGFSPESLRRVDLNISSNLQLLPNHQVLTTTRLEKIQALDKCVVSVMQSDITPQIMDSIKSSIETYCTSFDQFVRTVNNNEFLDQWRREGNRVFPFSNYGFFNLNLSELRAGRFNYSKDTLYFSLGFTGRPELSSDSGRVLNPAKLPPILSMNRPATINTYLNAVYDYDFIGRLLSDSLRNKPFEVEGRTFLINAVRLSGTDEGKINIQVDFSGNRKGTLTLSGSPKIDTARQLLTMPDISFNLESRDMLLNMAKGLFRKKIMRKLKDQSVFDLGALIERNKTAISARLNQPLNDWMETRGTFNQMKLVGILPQKDHLQVQVYVNAEISLIGSPPPSLLDYNN